MFCCFSCCYCAQQTYSHGSHFGIKGKLRWQGTVVTQYQVLVKNFSALALAHTVSAVSLDLNPRWPQCESSQSCKFACGFLIQMSVIDSYIFYTHIHKTFGRLCILPGNKQDTLAYWNKLKRIRITHKPCQVTEESGISVK